MPTKARTRRSSATAIKPNCRPRSRKLLARIHPSPWRLRRAGYLRAHRPSYPSMRMELQFLHDLLQLPRGDSVAEKVAWLIHLGRGGAGSSAPHIRMIGDPSRDALRVLVDVRDSKVKDQAKASAEVAGDLYRRQVLVVYAM